MNKQNIFYGYQPTPFGNSFIAWTEQKAICCFYFLKDKDNERIDFEKLKKEFAFDNVEFTENSIQSKKIIDQIFDLKNTPRYNFFACAQKSLGVSADGQCSTSNSQINSDLQFFLKDTNFQMKVWQALLKIPFGTTVSYKDLAISMGKPKAVRAVANAIAKNKLAFVIPCHRVISSSGKIGGYRWDVSRKQKILDWEASLKTL